MQLTKIEIFDNEIINVVKDTDVETEVSETQIYLDKYSDLILKIESVLKPHPQNNGNKSERQATTLNQSQSSSNKKAKVRLPKIELPHFDGNPLNFQRFWDLFGSTVDKNEHLSDVDKFSYLKNLLTLFQPGGWNPPPSRFFPRHRHKNQSIDSKLSDF